MSKLNQINIQGFKSIQQLENFELSNLNVLIGGNGAGKSNFIDVFRMLRAMMNSGLGGFAMQRGGADGFYRKRRDGVAIAQKIGLYTMREQCKLFNAWVERLECA